MKPQFNKIVKSYKIHKKSTNFYFVNVLFLMNFLEKKNSYIVKFFFKTISSKFKNNWFSRKRVKILDQNILLNANIF